MVSLGVLLLILLVACGGAGPTATSGASYGSGGSGSGAFSGGATTAAAATTAAGTQATAAVPTAGRTDGPAPNLPPPDPPKMVIKNGPVSLLVKDVDSAVNQIMEIATRHGGDVRQSTNNKTGDVRIADMLILVESSQFDRAMTAIRGIDGLVDRKVDKTESQEVSEEFVDVRAQIATLEATERQLRDQLQRTAKPEDTLTLQKELTNLRVQIDRLQTRANHLDRRAAMSTITLHIEMPPPAPPVAQPQPAAEPTREWRFSESVSASWNASLRIVQAVATVIVSVLVFCWWLIPLAPLGWLAARYARRRRAIEPAPPAAPSPPAPTPPTGDWPEGASA